MTISNTLSSSAAKQEIPMLSVAELDKDPHGVLRRYRPLAPVIRRDDGSYIVLRAKDVERLGSDRKLGFCNGPLEVNPFLRRIHCRGLIKTPPALS